MAKFKLGFWIFSVLVMVWAIGELVAVVILWRHPDRATSSLTLKKNHEPLGHGQYELNETLSKLPLISRGESSNTPTLTSRTHWKRTSEMVGDVQAPPAAQSAEAQFLSDSTQQEINRVVETTDSKRRRVPSWHSSRLKTAKQHILALGDSFAWGDGVKDDETLAAQLVKDDPNLISYSASYPGYGPAELIYRMKYGDMLDDVQPRQGVAFYFLSNEHFRRFFNSARSVASGNESGLAWFERNGEFEALGPVGKVSPAWKWFSWLWVRDPLVNLFWLDLPPMTEGRVRQMARAIQEMKSLYRAKTMASNPFVVVISPIDGFPLVWSMRQALDQEKIQYIDYSNVNMVPRLKGSMRLPDDMHPSPEFYEKVGAALRRDLLPLITK